MAQRASVRLLQQHLFIDPDACAYAVLDGASIPDLLDQLYELEPEHVCLYRGELEPDLAECAPYLVRLEPDSPFTRWVLKEGWGQHWGIFATGKADLRAMRKHFRTFLMVKDPDGKMLYFRYYDPRVMRVYLPTCTPEELDNLFGPVEVYVLEDEKPASVLRFWHEAAALKREEESAPEMAEA